MNIDLYTSINQGAVMTSKEPAVEAIIDPEKRKMFARTRNAIYYGLAIDSMARPLRRTRRLAGSLSQSMLEMGKSVFKGQTFTKVDSIEEIIQVHDDCASTMIGTVIVILFFAFFTFSNTDNTYALVVNGVLSLAFTYHFIANLFVYLRCQQLITEHRSGGNKSKPEELK